MYALCIEKADFLFHLCFSASENKAVTPDPELLDPGPSEPASFLASFCPKHSDVLSLKDALSLPNTAAAGVHTDPLPCRLYSWVTLLGLVVASPAFRSLTTHWI